MKNNEIQTIRSVLSANIGWSWPVVLVKALTGKNAVFKRTRWSENSGAESEFVKRLTIAPALYHEIGRKIGKDNAYKVMEELLVTFGCKEQWDHLNSLNLAEKTGMGRLMAFNDLMDQVGAPRFNQREYVKQDDNTCHFVITRCVFNDFYAEAGTPELAKLFCEVDHRFFPEAFPDFNFHRGGSKENTIAFGKDHCEFVFEKRAA